MRSRLRWLLVGGVLAALGGQLVWRIADGRHAAEATRQARAGHSLAVIATRDDWAVHVLPAALAAPGEAGARARTVASAKINQALSRAARGDLTELQQLATQAPAAIRSLEESPTHQGGRWGEWALRRLAAAVDQLPADQRVALLVDIDDTLMTLSATPRLAPEPVEELAAAVATPAAKPPTAVAPAPSAPVAYELVVRPTPTIDSPPAVQTEPSPQLQPSPPRVAAQWLRPRREAPLMPVATAPPTTPPASPITPDITTAPPSSLSDRELLSEALRQESLLSMSADGEPQAMGPSRVPVTLDSLTSDQVAEAAARARLDAIRHELVDRGYGGVTRRQVEGLLSTDEGARVALVEELLTDRRGDPARVLLLMARDESPTVRAAAISALGGATSRELVAKALELATQDQDLRVGRLAEPLRERLR
jgi:hypothetical protein